MSPVTHPVTGTTLAFELEAELRIVREQLGAAARSGRTLVSNGPLRATLVGLSAGGELAPHKADGPITVHVLEGTIEFEAGGRSWTLAAGSLLALEGGVVHAVRAAQGAIFLLTVVTAPAAP